MEEIKELYDSFESITDVDDGKLSEKWEKDL